MFESFSCQKCGGELEDIDKISEYIIRGYCPACDEDCEVEIALDED